MSPRLSVITGIFYVDGIKDITGIDASARVVANTATIVAAALDTREKLANAAYLDELTGIANRRGYTKLLREAIEKGERFAFLFIDLDGFKLINDLQSHEAGDRHLIKTAHTLRSLVKLPGRVGGDEFAAIVDPSSEPEAIAKSLNKAGIPCSVGVVYFPDDGSDVENPLPSGRRTDVRTETGSKSDKRRLAYSLRFPGQSGYKDSTPPEREMLRLFANPDAIRVPPYA